MRFETSLAFRHLKSGGGQTWLTVFAVAIAVTVIVFIECLLTGVQARILNDLLGALPHVTVKPPDPEPDTLAQLPTRVGPEGAVLSTAAQEQVQQRLDINNYQRLEKMLAQYPNVDVIASSVRGNAFLIRGEKRVGVVVSGGNPVVLEKIVTLEEDIIAGTWLGIGPDDVVIGWRLADEVGVKLGDRVRIESSQGIASTYRVGGIFDTGNNQADNGQVYTLLSTAQSLFATNQEVSSILLRLDDPFQANAVADQISGSLPYKTESWMREQAFIVNAFQSQNSTRLMIIGFALLASAFGIASVLIVSVIQKSKQIGILKSMGARDDQILMVFTLEGLFISLLGSVIGCLTGFGILKLLEQIPQAARSGKVDKLFNIVYDPEIFLRASLAAIIATLLAAWLPARRAARMNPVDVIRGG
ncbi:MAG: ABC transporter permease [Armatimonadaceae bacterium]